MKRLLLFVVLAFTASCAGQCNQEPAEVQSAPVVAPAPAPAPERSRQDRLLDAATDRAVDEIEHRGAPEADPQP